ncbi:MAG: dockerin type I repeat-containing protein, partial [Clostridia bacterium]|nr:dockerin type I repeat-containing protein [Clostridia bacterium]
MKKLCSIVLTVAMLIGMVSLGGFTVSAATVRAGDVDMNGEIASADARTLLAMIVGEVTMTAEQVAAADANADGKADTSDVKRILYVVTSGEDIIQTIDLLPPLASDWHNPVQYAAGAKAVVGVTENTSNGAQILTNYGGIWPYSAYVYDDKLLVPTDAVIEYDLTVNTNATSICIYTGGSTPDLDGDATTDTVANRKYFKLNSLISTNIEAASGDLLKGTYKGTINMADVEYDTNSLVDGMVWISGIKVYAVGATNTAVTIRKLQTTGVVDPFNEKTSTDPLEQVRAQLVDSTETAGLGDLSALELY